MMSIVLLSLFALVSNFYAAEPFTFTASMLSSPKKLPTVCCHSSQPDPENLFESIYNIDDNFSQEEALKSGIKLTKVIRQVMVDAEEEVKRLTDEIDRFIQKRAYSNLAFLCFAKYIESGKLTTEIENAFENGEDEKEKSIVDPIDLQSFDYDLMNACLAKYGMNCNKVETPYYGNKTCTVHRKLHDEDENLDEIEDD